jgi:hypothetical protein
MERQKTTRQRASLTAAKQPEKQSIIPESDLRHRAYENYLNRGPNPGNEIGDWLQAEQELKAN